MFPDDATLLARGKYSTLSHERREQLKRVQAICATLITSAQATLRDCESAPPKEPQHIVMLATCVENLAEARDRIYTLALGMDELKDDAWPK